MVALFSWYKPTTEKSINISRIFGSLKFSRPQKPSQSYVILIWDFLREVKSFPPFYEGTPFFRLIWLGCKKWTLFVSCETPSYSMTNNKYFFYGASEGSLPISHLLTCIKNDHKHFAMRIVYISYITHKISHVNLKMRHASSVYLF